MHIPDLEPTELANVMPDLEPTEYTSGVIGTVPTPVRRSTRNNKPEAIEFDQVEIRIRIRTACLNADDSVTRPIAAEMRSIEKLCWRPLVRNVLLRHYLVGKL